MRDGKSRHPRRWEEGRKSGGELAQVESRQTADEFLASHDDDEMTIQDKHKKAASAKWKK